MPKLHSALPRSQYCIDALSLVHWYTRHPTNPPPLGLDKLSHVTLIGNGNVSLDIARILLTGKDMLEKYDVPTSVLDQLARSNIKHVSIVARRGPFEAAFTAKELREMMALPDASMIPIDPAILAPPPDTHLTRQQNRLLQLLERGSKNSYGSTPKTWSLDFFRSPIGLTSPSSTADLAQLSLAHTMLEPGTGRAISTGETSVLPTSLVVTSLGFQSEVQAPMYDPALGHIRTISGRVVSPTGQTLRNVYASGWAAMGAKGVLASTMMDAYAVADTILNDSSSEHVQTVPLSAPDVDTTDTSGISMSTDPDPDAPPPEVQEAINDGLITQYEDWRAIDAEEVKRAVEGKERERMDWVEAKAFLDKL